MWLDVCSLNKLSTPTVCFQFENHNHDSFPSNVFVVNYLSTLLSSSYSEGPSVPLGKCDWDYLFMTYFFALTHPLQWKGCLIGTGNGWILFTECKISIFTYLSYSVVHWGRLSVLNMRPACDAECCWNGVSQRTTDGLQNKMATIPFATWYSNIFMCFTRRISMLYSDEN